MGAWSAESRTVCTLIYKQRYQASILAKSGDKMVIHLIHTDQRDTNISLYHAPVLGRTSKYWERSALIPLVPSQK
jgi:hypothetical protein